MSPAIERDVTLFGEMMMLLAADLLVIPAEAGIQGVLQPAIEALDSRLRGNDGLEPRP